MPLRCDPPFFLSPSGQGFRGRCRDQGGFTYVELAVVVVLIGVLVLTLIENILPLMGEAERVGLEQNRAAFETAVQTEVARRALRGDRDTAELDGSNPVDLMERAPGDYLGEFDQPDPEAKPGGHWYFDRSRRELVYVLRYPDFVHGAHNDPPRLRFRVAAAATEPLAPVRFVALDDYDWETDTSTLRRWATGTGNAS